MRMRRSTTGKMHVITKDGYYFCNRAVGKHDNKIIKLNKKYITCKNCIRKLRK